MHRPRRGHIASSGQSPHRHCVVQRAHQVVQSGCLNLQQQGTTLTFFERQDTPGGRNGGCAPPALRCRLTWVVRPGVLPVYLRPVMSSTARSHHGHDELRMCMLGPGRPCRPARRRLAGPEPRSRRGHPRRTLASIQSDAPDAAISSAFKRCNLGSNINYH